jgi:hypothetical protein
MKENNKGGKGRIGIMDSVYVKHYMQPAFLICVVILAAAGGTMSMVQSYFGVRRVKLPLLLKRPFDLMDETALAPYKVMKKQKIENPDIVEQLGTEDYIQWLLEDTEADPDSPTRFCFLFITYYTGTTQQVWHTPEECYFGAGSIKHSADTLTFKVDFKDDAFRSQNGTFGEVKTKEIPVRRVVFGPRKSDIWQDTSKFSVFYTFSTNGAYVASRTGVRIKMEMNLTGKYSYFSKVEWQFYNKKFGSKIYPTKEEAVTANQKLLGVILPILERQHWPDWKKAMSDS